MDLTQTLPDDLLASILRPLPPRDLAASRCVRKAWLAVVDAHRLLLPHVLPHSVAGLFLNYVDHHDHPYFFARPSVQPPAINGSLAFLINSSSGYDRAVDHCNGLLLCSAIWSRLCVVNPATRRWEELPWEDDNANPYLVFDPAVSPHYEVFSVPRVPKKDVLSSSTPETERLTVRGNLGELNDESPSEDGSRDLMEWPPSLWTLNAFSSNTKQWQMRLFVREGEAAGTMSNARLDRREPRPTCWGKWGGPRRRCSAYWQGSLYVHCQGAFFVRLSLSNCKYQVIKAPIDIKKTKHAQFLGKSEKGVYLATLHDSHQLKVWTLAESSRQIHWVLKHHIDLKPWIMAGFHDLPVFEKTWTISENDDVHYYYDNNYFGDDDDDDDDDDDEGVEVEVEEEEHEEEDKGVHKENNKMVMSEDREWNSDDDNVLNIEDLYPNHGSITFLGFHPYKEVVFLGLTSLVGVAYHLKSSKVQYLGEMRPKDYSWAPTNGIYESFAYTPCMIGELLKHASEGPRGYQSIFATV